MLMRVPEVFNAAQARLLRERLESAVDAWVDGRITAGHQGKDVKQNLQLAEDSSVARELSGIVVAAVERHPLFLSAALPARIYPPMFNRYDGSSEMRFGTHVDGAVRLVPDAGCKIRTDVAATLFLSDPESYDGGELVIEDTYGTQAVKLPAGHMVVYPATSRHRVTPVTRGSRLASFFWVQSMVRDDAQRALLFEMDMAIVRLTPPSAGHASLVELTGCYHNLLRMWAEV
jgi:PKHD-type hydroxylase